MKTKLIQKIKEETSQEPKCIFDHSNTLQLVSVHQDDGTWYRYCYNCKWIDVKEIISQSKEELVEENKLEKIRDLLEYQTDCVDIRLASEGSIEVAVFNPFNGENFKNARVQEYKAFNDTDEALDSILEDLNKK